MNYEELALDHGNRYTNRHFPDKPSYGFTSDGLREFAKAIEAAVTTKLALEGLAQHHFQQRWDDAAGRQPDQSVTPAYQHWLQTQARREGVAGNEAWNAGAAWAASTLVNPSPDMLAAAQRADMYHGDPREWQHDDWPDHLRVLQALIESAGDMGTPVAHPKVVHARTGGVYAHLGAAQLQSDKPLSDMASVQVYQGPDGRLWVRDTDEFRARFYNV